MATGRGRLQGKIAIVTGGASSIGRAICIAYANEGAKVVVADLREQSREAKEADMTTHELIHQNGSEASFSKVDVTDSASVDQLVADVVQKHGRLDVMVNNAGVALESTNPGPVWETTNDVFDKTQAVNTTGVFYGIRAASRQMIQQEPGPSGDRGWIVNTASIMGLVGAPSAVAYVASKHAVIGMTRGTALDCAPYRVHVNAICPGFIDTPLTSDMWKGEVGAQTMRALASAHPFKGMGTTQDIAPVAVFLASEDARWITGTGLTVDGGYVAQ